MIVAGVMSGSSMDGLDVAVVKFSESAGYNFLHSKTLPLPEAMKGRLSDYKNLSAVQFLELEQAFSSFVGEAVRAYLSSLDVTVDLLGVHGHTVIHLPDQGLTHQLGHGGIIASVAGIDTVTDFRMQDVAKRGVGTPLVSILESSLLSGYDYYLNLGGIANISKIAEGRIEAYDICPCNQVLNYLALKYEDQPYDDNGNIARKGNTDRAILEEVDQLSYWATSAPKSLDNNWIKDTFIPQLAESESGADNLHTLTTWMASQIANQIETTQATKMLVTGGGSKNAFLIESLREKLSVKNCQVVLPDLMLIDYKEALLMAYMAYLRVKEKHNVLSMVTHASSDTIAGAYFKK